MESSSCAMFSYRPEGLRAGRSKPSPFKRRYHVVLSHDAAKRLLRGEKPLAKKRLLAVAGLLLHPDDARQVARNLPV